MRDIGDRPYPSAPWANTGNRNETPPR
jgi:hypothetical protein